MEGGPRVTDHAAVNIGSLVLSFGGYSGADDSWGKPLTVDVFDAGK